MKNVFLGEYIKQRRLDLGLTQEQLCDGICEPMTLSRLENGKQTPSRNRINALLQRLGLPDDRYFALLSKNELEMYAAIILYHIFLFGFPLIALTAQQKLSTKPASMRTIPRLSIFDSTFLVLR